MRVLLWATLAIGVAACTETTPVANQTRGASNTGLRYLGAGDVAGFERALNPRPFEFPGDHSSHPRFRTEWWYFTGNTTAAGGRHFGFELTFFRVALKAPGEAPGRSEWRTDQVWMAHLAVTDTAGDRFFAKERMARGAVGLAGATPEPLKVWVADWSAIGTEAGARWQLRAHEGTSFGVDLDLSAQSAPVAQGDRGLDRKGAEPGNASYYYSVPRFAAQGTIVVDGLELAVQGSAWLDREWSTSALDPDVVGWDWFGLQLSDGSNLMVYRLRQTDGTASRFSGGTLVRSDGARVGLSAEDFRLEPLSFWTSSVTGVRYPVSWKLEIPKTALSLAVVPRLRQQEIDLSVRYWEGAVHASGTARGEQVTADGYLELAGYR